MDTIFMNSGNIKTSDIHLLIGLRRRDKYILYQTLSIYNTWDLLYIIT